MVSQTAKSRLKVESIFRTPYPILEKKKLVWINPDRVSGEALFYGTRVPVSLFLQFLEEGNVEQFQQAYPAVSKDQIIGILGMISTSRNRKPLKRKIYS